MGGGSGHIHIQGGATSFDFSEGFRHVQLKLGLTLIFLWTMVVGNSSEKTTSIPIPEALASFLLGGSPTCGFLYVLLFCLL